MKSVKDFDAKSLSKDERKSLLQKLLEEDAVEALIDGSGEEMDSAIENEVEFNQEVEKEEMEDEIEVTQEVTQFTQDFDYRTDLTENQLQERFNMRKELFDKECGNYGRNSEITDKDLQFSIASLSNVFYDDKYKIIMCAVPKAATSNWQRVLAVLKYNGEVKRRVLNKLIEFSKKSSTIFEQGLRELVQAITSILHSKKSINSEISVFDFCELCE